MTNLKSYHAFLIKNRIFCEYTRRWDQCFKRATTVRSLNGRDTVFCEEHAARLDNVRKSERKQDGITA